MRAEVKNWYERFIYPLAHALNSQNPAEFEQLWQANQQLLSRGALPPDSGRALTYMLAYYYFLHTLINGTPAEQLPALTEAQACFVLPARGDLSSIIRRRYRLQLHVLAHNYCLRLLPVDEMAQLLDELPPADRHSEQWIFISEYFFQQGDREQVSQAYETFIETHAQWAADYNWRRLNVMLKLLDDTAIQADAVLLIEAMPAPQCSREIRRSFWPHFARLGFALDELELALATRCTELERVLSAPCASQAE